MGSDAHRDAIDEVKRACERHGIVPGIHTSGGAEARTLAELGFKMCTLATDAALLRAKASAELAQARETSDSSSGSSSGGPFG